MSLITTSKWHNGKIWPLYSQKDGAYLTCNNNKVIPNPKQFRRINLKRRKLQSDFFSFQKDKKIEATAKITKKK